MAVLNAGEHDRHAIAFDETRNGGFREQRPEELGFISHWLGDLHDFVDNVDLLHGDVHFADERVIVSVRRLVEQSMCGTVETD